MTNSTSDFNLQRKQLSDYLTAHQGTILNFWRVTCTPDEAPQESARLSGKELADSLPLLLTFFTRDIAGESQERDLVDSVCQHQIHRWQRGYPLGHLLTEFDNFYAGLDTEIQAFLKAYPQTRPGIIALAYSQLRQLVKLVNAGVVLPVDQLEQTRADGQMKTLQAALDKLQQKNSQHLDRLRQIAHDLHNYLGIIATAASILREVLTDDDEVRYRDMIRRNVSAASHLINQLLTDAQTE
ncbi:hypothetical protein [Spirosoma sp. KUDC1026]|uniref:hypothetical protein n=1 Tax=Spirosoma sp. KUDC1026 TaxID=2745947 RepID=UPI00159B9523|nr:hypothetical protein [Spirosoma sp. KUDC1026]QKZ13818.1 hypothetical protein HU175_14730 [Spirosoma sp. KUDC1026]